MRRSDRTARTTLAAQFGGLERVQRRHRGRMVLSKRVYCTVCYLALPDSASSGPERSTPESGQRRKESGRKKEKKQR